ncbi:hydratase [Acetonema longum]|uniref:Putative hydratase n=1 Tax=Acetonema longum DSM 6540 TaxID=1009370 RepID=F7NGL7_9FIRM|nr:hydratase [Acetonema longum]EGO64821.1 putative hydratase [Acetonema longum DSM 6540]
MIELLGGGIYLLKGRFILKEADKKGKDEIANRLKQEGLTPLTGDIVEVEKAKKGTISYQILSSHNQSGDWQNLKLRFDALGSHDLTYVGIVQTAALGGIGEFPVPFVMTNCHNTLCAIGGTVAEDDHAFGFTAAQKYGGTFIPPNQAVIHQYMREMLTGCGKMILTVDSHTRYGALGTMGVGEGSPEIVKQMLNKTYDIAYPEVIAIYLEGEPKPGVGPHDVALAIIKAVYDNNFVTNKIMEFVGPGVHKLSVDFRNGIDVMTTETTCLSSIWCTDDTVKEYFAIHGRPDAYACLEPAEVSYYDGLVKVNLSKIDPMIALPFHPSNVWPIDELNRNASEILRQVEVEGQKQLDNANLPFRLTDKLANGRLKVEQGIVAGCCGGMFENITAMADILAGKSIGSGYFSLNVYPASQPIYLELIRHKAVERLMTAGAAFKPAFCGPCFGFGDIPAHGSLSIRHVTRNFKHREGSIPTNGQLASSALMDARSIAATALNGGMLTPATELEVEYTRAGYRFDPHVYDNRVYQGFGNPVPGTELKTGPNISSWPPIPPLAENLVLKIAAVLKDPVTTTDELIPSGEASTYRSNPQKLAEFTLGRKDPAYVGRSKAVKQLEEKRLGGLAKADAGQLFEQIVDAIGLPEHFAGNLPTTALGSLIAAVKPGDGSAREQAASSQKMLGGQANVAHEYATKRYRSNLINWGLLPFTVDPETFRQLLVDDLIHIPGIRQAVAEGSGKVRAFIIRGSTVSAIELKLESLSREERDIILAGCLINYYRGNC